MLCSEECLPMSKKLSLKFVLFVYIHIKRSNSVHSTRKRNISTSQVLPKLLTRYDNPDVIFAPSEMKSLLCDILWVLIFSTFLPAFSQGNKFNIVTVLSKGMVPSQEVPFINLIRKNIKALILYSPTTIYFIVFFFLVLWERVSL